MALWRIRATVDDRPGYLSVLTASLALRSVNILAVQVHTTEAGAVDDFLVDTPDTMTEAELLAAVVRGRGRDAFAARAEAQGLADQPTRALALAGRLVRDADALGDALVTLLDAAEVRWRPNTAPATGAWPAGQRGVPSTDTGAAAGFGFSAGRMTLADPAGGTFEVLRRAPAFTPAEYARAQALVEVSGALLRHHIEQANLLLPDGTELLIRPATGDDVDAVRRLHTRSSAASRRQRYPGSGHPPADARLRRMLEPENGLTLLAVHHEPRSGDEHVVAMANLFTEGDLGEVALLVADAWQRRSIGTALLRRLMAYALRNGFAALVAHTTADNKAMLHTLRRIGGGPVDRDGALLSVTLPVTGQQPATDETPAASGQAIGPP